MNASLLNTNIKFVQKTKQKPNHTEPRLLNSVGNGETEVDAPRKVAPLAKIIMMQHFDAYGKE